MDITADQLNWVLSLRATDDLSPPCARVLVELEASPGQVGRELAAAALLRVSEHGQNLERIIDAGGIVSTVLLLLQVYNSGDTFQAISDAVSLSRLIIQTGAKERLAYIDAGGFPALFRCIGGGTDDFDRIVLQCISSLEDTAQAVVDAGDLEKIVSNLGLQGSDQITLRARLMAVSVIFVLCSMGVHEICEDIVRAGCMKHLIAMLDSDDANIAMCIISKLSVSGVDLRSGRIELLCECLLIILIIHSNLYPDGFGTSCSWH